MRLWFIMRNNDKEIFLKDGAYYREWTKTNTKECDKNFTMDIHMGNCWRTTTPLVCFARLTLMDPCLSMFSLINNLDIYSSVIGGDLDGATMLEVELQEKDILVMREMVMPIDHVSPYEYGTLVAQDHFKDSLRNQMKGRRVVALTKRIREKDIVTQYSFTRVSTDKILMVNDIQRKDAFPLTEVARMYLSPKCGVFLSRASEKVMDEDDEFDYISKHSMSGAPRYFTLREAASCSNLDTIIKIARACKVARITDEQYEDYLVGDLFPDGLRLE